MRICIVGGGLAGTLLAWRLAQRPELERVDLLVGADGRQSLCSGGVKAGTTGTPVSDRGVRELFNASSYGCPGISRQTKRPGSLIERGETLRPFTGRAARSTRRCAA